MNFEELSNKVIGSAINVHRELGPGLLENAYQQCLAYELSLNKIPFQIEVPIPINYKDVRLDCGFRLDFLIDDTLILELKSVEKILPIHEAKILTYLKLSQKKVGLLINFNVSMLKNGIKRFVL